MLTKDLPKLSTLWAYCRPAEKPAAPICLRPPSRRQAKHGKVTVKAFKVSPGTKVLLPGELGYRAAGLRSAVREF